MGLVIRLLIAGASRASIIAKHGKKAYDAAKNLMKTKDKSIWSKLSKKDAEKYILGPIKEIKKAKNKVIKKEFKRPIRIATGTTIAGSTDTKIDAEHLLGWKKGGSVKTYAKGGGVRKPKY